MRIVLVHGFKASPAAGFWPWLRDELQRRGHDVVAVDLPNPAEPNCAEWVEAIDKSISHPGGDTIFIGHSLGCVALLHYLEGAEMEGTPKSVILIAPPYHIGSEKFESFFQPAVDFDTAMWKGQEFVVIASKDDDVIPYDHALKYEAELQAQLRTLEEGKHFVDATELPILLDLIDDRNVEPGESLNDDFGEIDVII